MIRISIAKQELEFTQDGKVIFTAPVSTAANGLGFCEGSYQTPTGNFRVREKIGDGAPLKTSFKGRLPRSVWNGEPSDDAILTRILWLDGLDEKNANTYQRYIYFHGTHAEDLIGQPASCGCIRLKNEDMLQLFELTPLYTSVEISL
ncbi:L,D-transpeptidase [Akkermansiaceae bacterium]|nr:L,D-transpeptidase [Akkermansiaceae bacterium]MDB4435862.1 L,D-transpeptidase [Akkermansiaceae bacterium]MDB4500913.1 L,D-transpeptidase [Akkermansiaceae bacterium]